MKKTRQRRDPLKVTIRNFKRLEDLQRLRKFQQHQQLIRQMRDAQMNADALEGYLTKMHYHSRKEMPDMRQQMKDYFVEQSFRGRGVTGQTVVDAFPSQYQRLREVLK